MPMKRTSIVFATFMLLCSITAGAWMHNTPCGKAVQTVSPDFFETEEDKALIRREFFDGPEWIQGDLGYITNEQRYDGVRKRVPARLHERLRACVDGWDFCMIPLEGAIPLVCKRTGIWHLCSIQCRPRILPVFFKIL